MSLEVLLKKGCTTHFAGISRILRGIHLGTIVPVAGRARYLDACTVCSWPHRIRTENSAFASE